MRDLFVFTVICGLMPACFRRPYVGLVVFSWLAYMRVQDLSWGIARAQRWSYYIAIITFVGYIVGPDKKRLCIPDIRCFIMIIMAIWATVGVALSWNDHENAFTQRFQLFRLTEYYKIVVIALFTTSVVKNREQLRVLVWVIALSFGFYALKNGLWGILTLGRSDIRRGPGGMLADNNDFALAMAMSVPMLFHVGMSEKKEVLRRVFFVLVPLAVITVALTHSRGGFLSVAGAIGVLIWRSRNRMMGIVIGVLVACAAVLLAPSSYKDRISSIKDYKTESSANSRFRSWAVAYRMAMGNPFFGVGLARFRHYYLDFEPDPTPKERSGQTIFVAHNSYLQVWAELGTPALTMYFCLILTSFWTLWRIRKEAKRRYYASWIINYAAMFESALVAFMIGSTFLNRAHYDLFYQFVAVVAVFGAVSRAEMRDQTKYPVRQTDRRGGEVRRIQKVGFGQRPRVSGFRNAPALGGGA